LNLALFPLAASQPAIRPDSASAMASVFSHKDNQVYLQNCWSEEQLSNASWSSL